MNLKTLRDFVDENVLSPTSPLDSIPVYVMRVCVLRLPDDTVDRMEVAAMKLITALRPDFELDGAAEISYIEAAGRCVQEDLLEGAQYFGDQGAILRLFAVGHAYNWWQIRDGWLVLGINDIRRYLQARHEGQESPPVPVGFTLANKANGLGMICIAHLEKGKEAPDLPVWAPHKVDGKWLVETPEDLQRRIAERVEDTHAS